MFQDNFIPSNSTYITQKKGGTRMSEGSHDIVLKAGKALGAEDPQEQ